MHYRARCLRPFVYERATKVEALRHGLLNKNGKVSEGSTTSTKHLLPTGAACLHCGKIPTAAEHKAICLHPLWQPMEESIQKGFLDLALVALLSSAEARDALVPTDDVEDTQPKKRIKKPPVSCQPAARAEAKGKAKAKAVVAKPRRRKQTKGSVDLGIRSIYEFT